MAGPSTEAEETIRQALQIALEHHQAGRLGEAERIYREVLRADPDNPDALHLLGVIAHQEGRDEVAANLIGRAIRSQPSDPAFLHNLGETYRGLNRLVEAERCYREALRLKPDYAEAHSNLGNALLESGRLLEAEQSYRQALALKPDFAEAHNNLGEALRAPWRLEQAERSFREALALKPNLAEAHSNLGNVLKESGRLDEAEQSYRHALALKPEFAIAHSNLIFLLDLQENCDFEQQQIERRNWYATHGRVFADFIRPHDNSPEPERRLRVGYVSADFHRHSAYYIFGPVIFQRDSAAFEAACYSGGAPEDDATQRLRQSVDLWRSTRGMSDEALAEQIRRDRIDILVDLSGHTAGNRLLVFARKPAPVQVTAWGHALGTGLATIDYFFADPVLVPQEMRSHLAEHVIDLPCFVCYQAPEYAPEVSPLPALSGRPFTFGSVNRIEKISDKILALWARILAGAPDSRLLVKSGVLDDPAIRENLLGRLQRFGARSEQVCLVGKSAHAEHFRIYHEIDVALDPYPHGGGVSSLEALWMGVPSVTLIGTTIPSRLSAGILSALELPDWIAHSEEQYVERSLNALRNLPALARLRQELRSRILQSPIGDLQAYTRAVEKAYRVMWRNWCDNRVPC